GRLTPTVGAAAAHLAEGPGRLEVVATGHSWLSALRRAPRLTRPVTVDLTPPTLEVLSQQHVVRLGGSECAVYRVGADAVETGVAVGEVHFPGAPGLFADRALRATLFAVPPDAPSGAVPTVVAADQAGNRRAAALRLRRPPALRVPRPGDRPSDAPRLRPRLPARQPRARRQHGTRRLRGAARHLRQRRHPGPRPRPLLPVRAPERGEGHRR